MSGETWELARKRRLERREREREFLKVHRSGGGRKKSNGTLIEIPTK